MILSYQVLVICTDQLEFYRYDMYVAGKLVKTEESEDKFNYAVIELKKGSVPEMHLRESHAEASLIMDYDNPDMTIKPIEEK